MTRTTMLAALVLALLGAGCSDTATHPSRNGAARPPARGSSAATDTATHAPTGLVGDVDGDGATDAVQLADGVVTVRLATGRRLTGPARGATSLVGLADVGGTGRAVVASASYGRLLALGLPTAAADDALVVLRAGYGGLGQGPASRTWLADDGRLLTGFLQFPRRRHTPVYAQTWTRDRDRLGLGQVQTALCWDRQASATPLDCAPGQDYRPAVGRRAGLPELFPAVVDTAVRPLRNPVGMRGITVQVPGGRSTTHDATVVLTDAAGVRHVAPLPSGPPPVLAMQPLDVVGGAAGSFGFVVKQLGGDSKPDAWQVYVWTGTSLRHLPPGPGRPGGYRTSWISRRGVVFTRQTTTPGAATSATPPTRFRVTRWRVTPAALTPVDLGAVCIDTFPAIARYGRC